MSTELKSMHCTGRDGSQVKYLGERKAKCAFPSSFWRFWRALSSVLMFATVGLEWVSLPDGTAAYGCSPTAWPAAARPGVLPGLILVVVGMPSFSPGTTDCHGWATKVSTQAAEKLGIVYLGNFVGSLLTAFVFFAYTPWQRRQWEAGADHRQQ
jgi:hypothetical protein